MVKNSPTLLEETIFQHVTIHKLMIYIYDKINMSQDPLLAVIRTNILELKKMARYDPLVIIASSKTVLKTLLNFTRLNCISKNTLMLIRRVMHDVYARMKKLWEIYKLHGSYEIKKKIKLPPTDKLIGKENIDTKLRAQKRTSNRSKNQKKKITIILPNPDNNTIISSVNEITNKRTLTNLRDIDIASHIRNSVVNEMNIDGTLDKSSLLERIKSVFHEENIADDDFRKESDVQDVQLIKIPNTQLECKTKRVDNKRRRIKTRKWQMGVIGSKKKRKVVIAADRENHEVEKIKKKDNFLSATVTDNTNTVVTTPVNVSSTPNITQTILPPKKPLPLKIKNNVFLTDLVDEDYTLDNFTDIINDTVWGDRLRIQRNYYMNEMSKVMHRLNSKTSLIVPKYDFIDKIADKLNISLTTYGCTMKEVRANKDYAKLVHESNSTGTDENECYMMESSGKSVTVGSLKATRHKKRFLYECLAENCFFRTTQLQVLHNHVSKSHDFEWDWICSSCGTVGQMPLLITAKPLDLALYHLISYHSSSALKRNPVDLEFTNFEIQMRNKVKIDSLISLATDKRADYFYKLYKCSRCNFSSVLYLEALNHFILESKEPTSLECLYCRMPENSAEDLCEHIETYHASSIYLCSECYYRSVALINTVNHFCEVHDNGKREILIYINSEPVVVNPMKPTLFPPDELMKYECVHPDNESFVTLLSSTFIKHINICSQQGGKRGGTLKKFHCHLCPMRVGNSYNLKQHYESHLVNTHICVYCGDSYSKLFAMEEHLFTKHMFWPPRFIIRENYDECPSSIISNYSSVMCYKTNLENLIEVLLEIDELSNDYSRIKLQTVSGEKHSCDSLLNKLPDFKPVGLEQPESFEKGGYRKNNVKKTETNVNLIDLTKDECMDAELDDLPYDIDSLSECMREIIELDSDSDEEDKFDSMNWDLLNCKGVKFNKKKGVYSRLIINSHEYNSSINEPSTSGIIKERTSRSSVSSDESFINIGTNFDRSFPDDSTRNLRRRSSHSIPNAIPKSDGLPSCSKYTIGSETSTSSTTGESPRQPEIRVIAEAKMDNFRKSLPATSNLLKLDNFTKNNEFSGLYQSKPSNSHAEKSLMKNSLVNTLVNGPMVNPGNSLSNSKSKSNSIIKILRIPNNENDNETIKMYKCPYCSFTEQSSGKTSLSAHISRVHVGAEFSTLANEVGKSFKCLFCTPFDSSFEAFASLHKHMITKHEKESLGIFEIYLKGNLLVRKQIKICFLCSTLIFSLEQLYKHSDTCPFAHTTPLNSSIVCATKANNMKSFSYNKAEIKVNKSIIELLQPHLPTQTSEEDVRIVKRAVAKKSTGPRPPNKPV